MKLSLLPPLVLLCSDLLLQNPSPPGLVMASRRPSYMISHPSTGSCVLRKSLQDPLKLGPCEESDSWAYTPQRFLMVKGTYFCLKAVESGKPAKLSIQCTEPECSWDMALNGKTPITTKLPNGETVCLDVGPDGTLMTNSCLCNGSNLCQSESQIFEFAVRRKVEFEPNAPELKDVSNRE